jgi:hypothetical protein
MSAGIDAMLAPLAGKRIAGGCDSCDAYQTVRAVEPGLWTVTVHHDDWCPLLAAIEARRG